MNRQELKDRLVAAGVPEVNYFIVGIDSQATPGKGGGFGELGVGPAPDGAGWHVFTFERGAIRRDDWFATEDEACETAWEDLRPTERKRHRQTPEERERALARSRQAIADYEKIEAEYRKGQA